MKNERGVTLVALIITIIVMVIIIGITVSTGGDLLQKSKMTDYIGYMELVKARADDVLEEKWFGIANNLITDIGIGEQNVKDIDDSLNVYVNKLDNVVYVKWGKEDKTNEYNIANEGIDKSILGEGQYFVIVFDTVKRETVDVIYSAGCKIDSKRYYTLKQMKIAVNGKTTAKNLIKNGDFSEGFEYWVKEKPYGEAHEISSDYSLFGEYSFKKPITTEKPYNYISQYPGFEENHKYYISMYAYNSSDTEKSSVNFDIGNAGCGDGRYDTNGILKSDGWTKLSVLYQSDGVDRKVAVNYINTQAVTYIDGVSVIDLTTTFGEGKEPSKDWCDENLDFGNTY